MTLYNKIKGLFYFGKENTLNRKHLNQSNQGQNKKGIRWRLKRQFKPKADFQIGKWESALMQAKNPDRPQRLELYSLYDWAMLDAHLQSQIRTAHITIQRSAFEVHIDGVLDDALTDLFKRPWFIQYITHTLDTEFWGHSLVEFDPNMDNGEFTQINLIEREHVRPETREVLLRTSDNKGICYADKPFDNWLISIGSSDDLGLLKIATKEIIYKDYSRRDWSIRSEKFGMPFLVLKTNTTNAAELDEKEEMCANFGANGYTIVDTDDEYALLEPKSSGGHEIYKDLAEYSDKNISKLINGQGSTSDEKSFTGAAEVHERILNSYSYSRLRRIQYHLNFVLLPFLTKHGYPLSGATFQFKDLIEQTKETSYKDKESKKNEEEQKKKKTLNKVDALYLFYNKYKEHPNIQLSFDVDKIIDDVIKKVHENNITIGGLHADTWQSNVQEIWQGVQNGFTEQMEELSYNDPSYELMTSFKDNIQVFAAFKNHQEISSLVGLLKDETGATRSFSSFKALAAPLSKKYNTLHLKAEYNHAIASAQMADKWMEFEVDKERLPYIRYRTQKDERVRSAHQKLDGITLPIEHEFWDSFFPANDWGCRCFAENTDKPNKSQNIDDLPNLEGIPSVFRNNPARSGELFTDQHPYFEGMDSDQAERIIKQKNQFVYNDFDDKKYDKLIFDKKTAGYAVKHKNHKSNSAAALNQEIATILAKKGKGIELLEDKGNLPDAIIDGKVWTFRKEKSDSIATIKDGAKRILLFFEEQPGPNINTLIAEAVEGTSVKEVGILYDSKFESIITE